MMDIVWTRHVSHNGVTDWEDSEWYWVDADAPVSMAKGGGGQQAPATQTVVNEPPAYLAPYLTEAATEAQSLYKQGPTQYYQGNTVVPFSPETLQSQQMVIDRATQGSPFVRGTDALLAGTVGGDYLASGNPQLQSAIDAATSGLVRNYQQATAPGIDSAFSRAGRGGSGAYAQVANNAKNDLAGQIGNVATNMAYQNYGDERTRQLQAAALAPSIAGLGYTDAAALAGVGQQKEGLTQAQMQDQIDRFNYEQNAPALALNQYISQVMGSNAGGGTSTTTAMAGQNRSNPFLGGIGGAMSGAGLAGSLGLLGGAAGMTNPLGLGIMALGGLGGLFG